MTPQPTLTPANATAVIKKYGGKEIKPVAPLSTGLVIGFYGPGGTGKTTLASTIIDSELGRKALWLNRAGNPWVVASKHEHIDVLQIEKFSEIEAIRKDIVDDGSCPYKTVVYDTVTAMYYMRLAEIYGPTADIKWEMHSEASKDIDQLVENGIALAEGPKKMNVVFIFQDTQENRTIRGQKNVQRSEIAVNRANQNNLPGKITLIGRLYISESTPPFTRLLDFTPIETEHQAKFQTDPGDELMKAVPMMQYNPSLASILDTYRGRVPWPTAKHTKPSAVAGGNRS